MRGFEDDKSKVDPEIQKSGLVSDVLFGAVFFLGGVYMILAFSSFWIFIVGSFCVIIGAAGVVGGLPESRIGEPINGKLAKSLPSPDNENKLLLALHEKEGGLSPAEAAIAASLTVREAVAIPSELAGRGCLAVESDGGTLFYSTPRRNAE